MTTSNESRSREQHARHHTLWWFGSAIIVSLLLAALLMRSWTLFWIAVPLGIVFFLLTTFPVFLAIIGGDDKKRDRS